MEIEQINESFGQKLYNLLRTVSDNQYVQCPCRVTAVNGNYVDVVPIINDDMKNQELYDVKIRHLESSTAYIYLGVHVEDKGVLRFFDRSIDDYSTNGSEGYNEDDRIHDVNDGLFELGFVPDNEAYVYPTDKEIEIGLKDQTAKISFANGNITFIATNINTQGNITHTGNLRVNGTLTATEIISENGATGTFANQVTTTSGIVTSGS